MPVKYVFVTGGVVSGLGKGITAASLGRLLKARGYKVTMQKFDPYINIDPGTMNPIRSSERTPRRLRRRNCSGHSSYHKRDQEPFLPQFHFR